MTDQNFWGWRFQTRSGFLKRNRANRGETRYRRLLESAQANFVNVAAVILREDAARLQPPHYPNRNFLGDAPHS